MFNLTELNGSAGTEATGKQRQTAATTTNHAFWDQDGHRHDQYVTTTSGPVPGPGGNSGSADGNKEAIPEHWMGLSNAQLTGKDKVC